MWIFIGFFSLFLIGVIAFNISSYQKRKQAEVDGIKFSEICDSVKIITEQPEIGFTGFDQKDINILKFELKRNGAINTDTIIKNQFSYVSDDKTFKQVKIPFAKFLKTDTIIVTTQNNLKFYISGYNHYAGLHYGMMGYVGGYDCALSENVNINKSETNGTISKHIAWLETDMNNRIKVLSPSDEEFLKISEKSKINKKKAEEIFMNNRKNEHWMSQIFCGMYINKNGNFYIFEEEREDKKGKKDVIKIDAETGEFQRFENYPFN